MLKIKNDKQRDQNIVVGEEKFKHGKWIHSNVDILDLLPDAVLLRDMNRTIVYANDAACWLYGYDRRELIGMDTKMLLADERVRFFGNRVEEAKQTGQSIFKTLHQRKDKKIIPVEIHMQIIEVNRKKYVLNSIRDRTEQELAEEALKESEEKFRNLFENSPVGLAIASVDGSSVERNKTLQQMLGYESAKELAATSAEKHYLNPEDRKRFLELHRKGPVRNFEVQFKRKDGTLFWISMASVPYKDKTGDKFITVTQDVTERKKAEEELKLRALILDSATDGIFLRKMDGTIIYANGALCKLYGYKRDELVGANFLKIIPSERIGLFQTKIDETRQKGEAIFENIHIRKDGSRIPVEAHIRIIESGGTEHVLSVIRDITERKLVEDSLMESEEKFRSLFENSPVGIAIASYDGLSVERNNTLQKMLGYDSKEELSKTTAQEHYFEPKDRERFLELHRMGPVHNFEARFRRKNGSIFWASIDSIPYKDKSGDKFITVTQDTTERKETEKKLKEYHEKIRLLASSLSLAEEEERRRIAVGIHDSVIQSLTLCLIKLSDIKEDSSLSPLLPKIIEINDILSQSVTELRSLAFNLSCPLLYEAGFEAAIGNLSEEIGKQYGIEIDFDSDFRVNTLTLAKDLSILLYQIIRELLINVGKHAKAKRVTVRVWASASHIQIIVEDDGIGFEVSKVDSLNKDRRGFGLFSVEERLNYLGGRMEIRSSLGLGTRVTIQAPLSFRKSEYPILKTGSKGKGNQI